MARIASVTMCTHPGCRVVVRGGGTKCEKHKAVKSDRPRRKRDKFLDCNAWRRTSAAKLQETPWCEECERKGRGQAVPAHDVDHILPRCSHPNLAFEPSNLQSLCLSCHWEKIHQGL